MNTLKVHENKTKNKQLNTCNRTPPPRRCNFTAWRGEGGGCGDGVGMVTGDGEGMMTGDGEGMIVVRNGGMVTSGLQQETLAEMMVDVLRHRPRAQRRQHTAKSREGGAKVE
jgi:hypothetical protein